MRIWPDPAGGIGLVAAANRGPPPYLEGIVTSPPIGNLLPVENMRRCTHDPSLRGDQVCAKRARYHVDWNTRIGVDDPRAAAGFTCQLHHDHAQRMGWLNPPAGWHELGADCGMPGALWFTCSDGTSFCSTPNDAVTAPDPASRELVSAS